MHAFMQSRWARTGLAAAGATCLGASLLVGTLGAAPVGAAPTAGAATALGDPVVINYDDFADASALNLRGSATVRSGDNALQLTSATNGQAGAAWLPPAIDPSKDFSTDFTLNLHDANGCHADGIDFVIQNAPQGNKSLGDVGGAMGYSGISPSFAAEFDIYGQNPGDPSANHVGFVTAGDPNNAHNPPDWTSSNVPPLYGSGPIHAWLDYSETAGRVKLYVATTTTKPATPVLDVAADLSQIVGDTAAFAGFTAGTGACNAVQDVQNWHLSAAPGVPQNVTMTLAGNPTGPVAYGTTSTFTATVTRKDANAGAPLPTGSVDFSVDGTSAGSAPVHDDGTASFTPSAPLSEGTHRITASYAGDGDASAIRRSVDYVVVPNTTMSLDPDFSSGSAGDASTFRATVRRTDSTAPVPTGTVDFSVDGQPAGSAPLDGDGVASYTTSSLSVGNHTISAVYAGDGVASAARATLNYSVTRNSTIALSIDPAYSATEREPVTLTATIARTRSGTPVPTGTVTFTVDGEQAGSAPLDGDGVGSYTTSSLSSGYHTITADYAGDGSANAAQATRYDYYVGPNTFAYLYADPTSGIEGRTSTFTAYVARTDSDAPAPTGTVDFYVDGAPSGSAPLDGTGAATFASSTLTAGYHTIVASYAGDGVASAASTTYYGYYVAPDTTLVLSSNPDYGSVGQPSLFTATVSRADPDASIPTGTVDFTVDGKAAATAPLDDHGVAGFTTSSLSVGYHVIQASYAGDDDARPAMSLQYYYYVYRANTKLRILPADGTTVAYGARVNAVVSQLKGSPPTKGTGTIDWYEINQCYYYGYPYQCYQYLVSTPVTRSKSVLPIGTLKPGTHNLLAYYDGDDNFSYASVQSQLTVTKASSTTTLSSTQNPADAGTNTFAVATVKPQYRGTTVTGQVTFSDAGAEIGTVTVSPQGVAKLALRRLAKGTHAITATYSGDDNFAGSASKPLQQKIT